jgi:hypothetical protein
MIVKTILLKVRLLHQMEAFTRLSMRDGWGIQTDVKWEK